MEIREAEERDIDGIRELFRICFGRKLSYEEWVWKYRESPWGSYAVVAVDGERIITHYGGLRMRFHFENRLYTVFQPCDVMTHPRYRARFFCKRGILVRTGEYFYSANPMDFVVGFPSERHAILGRKQLGGTEHDYVTVLSKRVSKSSFIWSPLLRVETGWEAIDGQEIDMFWEKVKNNYGLSIEKKSRYLFWRYRDNPVRRYEPLIVRGRFRRDLKAFGVFSIKDGELMILDLFCVKGIKTEVFMRLFEAIAIKNGLEGIRLWAHPDEEMFRVLLNLGYKPEKGIPYIFKILNKEISPSFLFDNYYYRMGDYDAV